MIRRYERFYQDSPSSGYRLIYQVAESGENLAPVVYLGSARSKAKAEASLQLVEDLVKLAQRHTAWLDFFAEMVHGGYHCKWPAGRVEAFWLLANGLSLPDGYEW